MSNFRHILFSCFFTVACLGTEEPNISSTLITPECFSDSDCGGSPDLPCMVPVCNPLTFTCGLVQPDEDEDGSPDMYCGGNDCDDGDETVFPENNEICDTIDNDCDGDIDEGLDCAGIVATDEVCDGLDNDLDGQNDEGLYTLDSRVSSLYQAKKMLYVGMNAGYIYVVRLNQDNRIGTRVYSDGLYYVDSYDDILPEEDGRDILAVTMRGAHIYILASYETVDGAFIKWKAFDYINNTSVDSTVIAGAVLGSIIVTEDYVYVVTYTQEAGEVNLLVFNQNGSLISEYPIGTYNRIGKLSLVDCDNIGVLVLSAVGSTLGKIEYFGFDSLTMSVDMESTLINLAESQDIYDFNFVCSSLSSPNYLGIITGTVIPYDDRVTLSSQLFKYDESFTQIAQIDLIPPASSISPPSSENLYALTIIDTGFSLGATLASWDRLQFQQFNYDLGGMIDPIDMTTSPIISGPISLWFRNHFAIFWAEDDVSTNDELIIERSVHCRN